MSTSDLHTSYSYILPLALNASATSTSSPVGLARPQSLHGNADFVLVITIGLRLTVRLDLSHVTATPLYVLEMRVVSGLN